MEATSKKSNELQTIGRVAVIVGVSPTTIRLLEAQAHVIPYRTATNLRLYDPEMVAALCAYRRTQQERNIGHAQEMEGVMSTSSP